MIGRLIRSGMAALVALVVGSAAASCVSLLQLDGYGAAASQLCSLLRDCYGQDYFPRCLEHADPRLEGATAAEREAWLTMFADSHCLESCLNAEACLDESPVCGSLSVACDQKQQCCGFLPGGADCSSSDGSGLGGGACCIDDGSPCTDTSQCCRDECRDDTNTCGERPPCLPEGVSCVNDFRCCSLICNPLTGTCNERICGENGAECVGSFECCDGVCVIGADGAGICGEASCSEDGASCIEADECCNGSCIFAPAPKARVCSSGLCVPDAIGCGADEECCSGYCDPEFERCGTETPCLSNGTSCETNSQFCTQYCEGVDEDAPDAEGVVCACRPDGIGCNDHFECCSADGCVDGLCAGGGTQDFTISALTACNPSNVAHRVLRFNC